MAKRNYPKARFFAKGKKLMVKTRKGTFTLGSYIRAIKKISFIGGLKAKRR